MNPAASFRPLLVPFALSLLFSPSLILFNQSAHAATLHQVLRINPTPQATPPPQAPIPTQIAAAHTVFLVNDGADANFPISAEDAYSAGLRSPPSLGTLPARHLSRPGRPRLPAPRHRSHHRRRRRPRNVYSINSPPSASPSRIPKPTSRSGPSPHPSKSPAAAPPATTGSTSPSPTSSVASRSSPTSRSAKPKPPTSPLYPHYHGAASPSASSPLVGAGVAAGLIMKHEFDNKVASQNAALCAQNTFFCNLPTP